VRLKTLYFVIQRALGFASDIKKCVAMSDMVRIATDV